MWDPYAEFQSEILPNGLTVHAAHWLERPWEAMGFLIHSGAEHDPIGLEGLSHFVEHLISENTDVPKKNLSAFFEDCGGQADLGRTGHPHTCYRFFVPTDQAVIAKAFSMFGHMLFSAKLEKVIERERQVIIGEFHRSYPVKFKLELAARKNKALYAGYWLERFVGAFGAPESVGRATQNDLQSHYDTHYTPANMSIVGVGGMTLSELVKLLSQSPFATIKKGAKTPLPIPATDVAPPLETRHVLEMSEHLTMPTEVGAYQSVAKIPGNVNARAVLIMKKMFDEALTEEVRERRAWAYDINSARHNFRHFHEFSINCGALALTALNGIEEVVEICIASMKDREDLFKHAKQCTLASNSLIDPTGRGICDGALDDLADNQRIISLTEYLHDIKRVTMNDIHDLLQWLRPERRWTLITRP